MTRSTTLIVLGAILTSTAPGWTWPGDLDPTFGNGGKVATDFGGVDGALAALVEPDGHIVAAGFSDAGAQTNQFALARYDADGDLDPAFGTGGKVLTAVGDGAGAGGLARQADGKLIAAGSAMSAGQSIIAVVRYDTTGDLDPSFGSGGVVTTAIGVSSGAARVTVQPDDKIVVAGCSNGGSPSGYDFAVARYDQAGNLDPMFGAGGIVVTDVGDADCARVLIIQPDGKILVGGVSTHPYQSGHSHASVAVARYDADGTLDPTFGSGGIVLSADFQGEINGIALPPDGKLLAAGVDFVGFKLARYNADGTPDSSFGTAGFVTSRFGGNYDSPYGDAAFAFAVQPDRRIIAAGRAGPSDNGSYLGLIRYEADGTLDRSFAPCGAVVTSVPAYTQESHVQALVVQPDGKLLAVARFDPFGDFLLARYTGVDGTSACEPAVSRKASVGLRRPAGYRGPSLRWRWKGVGAVDRTDFGDPTVGTDLLLCVIDAATGGTLPFKLGTVAPANPGSSCVSGCWRPTATGYLYTQAFGLPDGITRVDLSAGAAGKATIHVRGGNMRGINRPIMPPFPLSTPVVVRLVGGDAPKCWEATFSSPTRSTDVAFTAQSD